MAATSDRDGQRQPSELVPYTGASGYIYYKNTLLMKVAGAPVIRPAVLGAGASNGVFLGVNENRVDLSAGLGSSQEIINTWKRGEFTFLSQGTGISAHIGLKAYAIDDQTVGVSAAVPALFVGEIMAIPTATTYRVRIDNAVGMPMSSTSMGASWVSVQN